MEAVGPQLTTMVPFGSGVGAGRSNVSFFPFGMGQCMSKSKCPWGHFLCVPFSFCSCET